MSNTQCELVCRIEPRFQQSLDVVSKLRSYQDERFALRLIESTSSTLLGELRFRAGPSGLPESTGDVSTATAGDPRSAASNDLDLVFQYERQLRTGPMSITFSDGTFTFGAILDCSKGRQDVAEQLVQQYAIAFLSTLGPFALP